MRTPYDGKIAIVHWESSVIGEQTIDDVLDTLEQWAPNCKAIWIKTSDGSIWQGAADDSNKTDLKINGTRDIERWVTKCTARGYEVHAWAIPRGLNPDAETRLIAEASQVDGLKSMILDVEVGPDYFRGGPRVARQMAERLRNAVPDGFHLALNLDARGFHPRDIHITEWLPFVDSLHPMVYHQDFGTTPTQAVQNAFDALAQYNRPIIPMLQAYNLREPNDVFLAGDAALRGHNAAGISYFRLGKLGPNEFRSLQELVIPGSVDLDPIEYDFTRQQLLDAIAKAARSMAQDPRQWIRSAGLDWLFENPGAAYIGLPIEQLPGLTTPEKQLILETLEGDERPTPAPDGDEVAGLYTNQQMINAFFEAAKQIGKKDSYWDMIVAAELESMVNDRQVPYDGAAIGELPGLTNDFKRLLLLALRNMPQLGDSRVLDVPWVSQLDADSPGSFDCGQACVLMLLKYHKNDSATQRLRVKDLTDVRPDRTSAAALRSLARHFGLALRELPMQPSSIDTLYPPISNGRPVILLVNYADLDFEVHLASGINQGLHWIVVIGHTANGDFIVHDPLWTPTQRNGKGGASLPITKSQLRQAIRAHGAPY